MFGPILLVICICVVPLAVVFYVKKKTKGRMLCSFIRKDRGILGEMCELKDDFVIHGTKAYDVYPELVRFTRWPGGWPSFLQEIVPTSLYFEEDAVPLDWINLDNRMERAMELRSALDENFFRKLVHEATLEGDQGRKFNFRKLFPILLIAAGAGLVIMLVLKGGCLLPGVGG